MKKPHKHLRNRKGIQTILAALLMVVIVVVAAVMVYAWSTGLLGTLLVNPNNNKDSLTFDPTFGFACSSTPPCTNVTLYIRNAGSTSASLVSYYVSNTNGTWQVISGWTNAPSIAPNGVVATNFLVGATCTTQYSTNCQYTGTSNGFNGFVGGYQYTIKVVTAKGTPFSDTVTR